MMVLVPLFALMGAQNLKAQEVTVTGNVSEMDLPGGLPGVNVIIQGTTQGTVTSVDGDYSITVPGPESVLVFSSVGYISEEITVGNRSTIDVTLVPDITSMEEVVVVGYGTQKKVNLTGAVAVIDAEELQNRPIANTGEGLQGLVPNLNVRVESGDPAASPSFNIRGYESINGGSPLILVDNVPMDINRINPEDIASISVLKDGAASAIYGARAAFGVILVETKKGKKGINVKLGTQLSWNKPIWHVDPITNGYEYALERNIVSTQQGGSPYYTPEYMESLKAYWDDPANAPAYAIVDGTFENYAYNNLSNSLMTSTSPRQKYDLSISGASERASFYTSFGAYNADGYINHPANDNFKRYNILMKGNYEATEWLSFDQSVIVNLTKSDKPSEADINSVIRTEPIRPFVVPRLEGFEEYEGEYWSHAFLILPELERGGRENVSSSDTWLKSAITLTPLNRLTLTSSFAYNIYNRQREEAKLPFEVISLTLDQNNPVVVEGADEIVARRDYNQGYVWNSYAEYLIDDLDKHYIKAMVGFNQEWENFTFVEAEGNTFITPNIVDIGAVTGTLSATGGKAHVALRGAFYRLNYIFDDRYLFEINGRYDGTSRFPKDDRFGFFPSFSAGWRISEESFMAGTRDVLDNLKIRASYGSLGNQLLGSNYYPYIPSMNIGFSDYVFSSGQSPYVSMPGIVSPTLTWEEVISKNIGLDVMLFSGKLDASFNAYTRETKDMLMRKDYPDVLGTSAPQENAADLITKGWEVNLKWRDNVGKDFSYNINFNISDWTSEITKYDNPTGAISEYYVGQQLGEIWGFETVGIIQTEEQLANMPSQDELENNAWEVGDIQYKDLNGDGVINTGDQTLENPGDRRIIGNSSPRYSFGLNTGISYKAFSLNVFFQGIGKRDYMPSRGSWTWFYPWRSYYGDKSWLTDTWREDNTDAYFPESELNSKNFENQTRFLQNAAYIRLKNITISYNLPQALISRIGLSGANIFVGGQNLWEYSKIRKPLDPEYVFDSSIDYPLFRSFTVGANFNF